MGVKRSSALPQEMAREDGVTRATPVMWAVEYGIQRTGASWFDLGSRGMQSSGCGPPETRSRASLRGRS